MASLVLIIMFFNFMFNSKQQETVVLTITTHHFRCTIDLEKVLLKKNVNIRENKTFSLQGIFSVVEQNTSEFNSETHHGSWRPESTLSEQVIRTESAKSPR